MSRKVIFLVLVFGLCGGTVFAAVPIEVENYSFELPGTVKTQIDQSGSVPGWTKVDLNTEAGVEEGWSATDGTWTGFMGNNSIIYNFTDFLIMEGDEFQLAFDARSTYHGDNLAAQLYYDDAGNRVVFATKNIDLWNKGSMATYTLYGNSISVAGRDHKIGIQFQHTRAVSPDDNIWCGLDNIRLTLMTPLIRAQNPFPEHESSYVGSDVTLTWEPGPDATAVDSYRLYFNRDRDAVNEGTPVADKGSTNTASYTISGLVQGLTYYWRIDTVIGADTYRGNIWTFTTKPVIAYNPDPGMSSEYVAVDPVLRWDAGSGAVQGHVVFFSDNLDDVNNAPVGTSGSPPFRAYLDVADTNWAPSEAGISLLKTSTTYYWRIDEVESTIPEIIYKGDIWSFTTVPVPGLGSILRELYEGIEGSTVADLTNSPNYPDNPNSSYELTSFEAPPLGTTDYGSRTHGWLYIQNSGDYTFWIASCENSELWLSADDEPAGVSLIAYVDEEEDRDGWTLAREWDKYPEIQQSDQIYFEGGNLYYIMALHKKAWGLYENLSVAWSGPDSNGVREVIPGTSLIPFEYTRASLPVPTHRATEVQRQPTLSWTPGRYAVTHDLYFGSDLNDISDVNTANLSSYPNVTFINLDVNSYEPDILEYNKTYYWRVDEVNDAHEDKLWKGAIWSFTVGNYLIVDDFEDYNDYEPDRIFDTWVDGWNVSENGAIVGYDTAHFAEMTIVHSGSQSMPFFYDNTAGVTYSEATRTFDALQDWTREDVQTLTLFLKGYPMVFVEDPAGTYTMSASGTDTWDLADEFRYAYKTLSGDGSITARVVNVENTNVWAKAGVMIRETLDPYSTHGFMLVTPDGRRAFQNRPVIADESFSANSNSGAITLPAWVRLVRQGNSITAYYKSENDPDWVQQPDDENTGDDASPNPQTIVMRQDVYVGLAYTSHSPNIVGISVFSDVTTTGTVTGADWQVEAIGVEMPANNPQPLYVAVEGGGTEKTVEHPDNPNVVLSNDWLRWDIPLNVFSDAGVNLPTVQKITIGVGSKTAGQQEGAGTLYIDDIRLYRPTPSEAE